jgi:hypothetical protein
MEQITNLKFAQFEFDEPSVRQSLDSFRLS